MASDVSIVNRALTKLGADRILLLTDPTQQARVMNAMYADVRDAELARHHWKFAIKRAQLVALVDAPNWGYQYQYPLPADYLGLVQVGDIYVRCVRRGTAPWSIEGQNLLTDQLAPLKFRYLSRVENPGFYHPLFVEALACKLAMEGCEALTQSNTKKQSAMEEYKFALSEATRMDAIENPPDMYPDGSWLDSRMSESRFGTGGAWQSYPSGV